MSLTQLKSVLAGLTMDWHTAKMTIKMSISPTILVCAIQSDVWIGYFDLNAYLAPIGAACVMAGYPQGMLIEFNAKQTFGYCVAYCWTLLAGWCGLQARKHTSSHAMEDFAAYNSSAETVVAVFLVVGIWFAFTVKSAFLTWNIQASLSAILAVAVLPALPRATSMHEIIRQSTNAFAAFLAGQAIGCVGALLIFPQTCKGLFKRDAISSLDALTRTMQAHKECIHDVVARRIPVGDGESTSTSVAKLESVLRQLGDEVAKANSHVEHAARKISWGTYDQPQLEHVFSLLVHLVPPVSGLSLVADMMQRHTEAYSFTGQSTNVVKGVEETGNQEDNSRDEWQKTEVEMHVQLGKMIDAISGGAEHARIRLQQSQKRSLFSRSIKKQTDEENCTGPEPGRVRFIESYRDLFIEDRYGNLSRKLLLSRYIQHRPQVRDMDRHPAEKHINTLHYFALLHSQTILIALGCELLSLLIFLDNIHVHPKRLIVPNFFSLHYWTDLFSLPCTSKEAQGHGGTKVGLDPVFHKPRNPDHLLPANATEAVGDCIRKMNAVLRSDHAAYGLRGVCAIMTIAIIAFLHDSQNFYFAQRFLWALFAILLSMGRMSGTSTFLLLCRLLGTVGSMVASYIIWYIVDERTPGVLVFMWLWFLVISYLMVKFPVLFSIWFVGFITAIVMIGIELQTAKIGRETVEQSGQSVYAPYIIFPYRLGVVALGVITAYIWTVFPYPISEHSELRENTAQVMYELSRYYMCIQQTVFVRLHCDLGDADDKASPGFRLQAALRRLFLKYRRLSAGANKMFQFLDWEFSLGGRFPKKTYREILDILDKSGSYMALTSFLSRESKLPAVIASCWAENCGPMMQIDLAPHGIASCIIILHSALGGGHPLPPGLHPLAISHLLEFLNQSVSKDDEFAVVALIHNVHWLFIYDVNRLIELVRNLVGELKFSFIADLDHSAENSSTEPGRPAPGLATVRP